MKEYKIDYRYKSCFDIDFTKLKNEGINVLLFDLDGTLVPHNNPLNLKVSRLLWNRKQEGFEIFIVTNNSKKRCYTCYNYGFKCIYRACKPSTKAKGILKDAFLIDDISSACVIGDEITDVMFANNLGVKSIIVSTLTPRKKMVKDNILRVVKNLGVFSVSYAENN